ncbi:MAG: serine protease [Bdellovibrionota bacterium]|nr:serine protease [Bdellovibrionota bacterium]
MISKKLRAAMFIAFFSLFSLAAKSQTEKAIYGLDNRLDLYQVSNPQWLKNARAIAAFVPTRKIKKIRFNSDMVKLKTKKIEDNCKFQRFNRQRQVAKCSGFLVGKDLLVTAGHCVRTRLACLANRWVFGFDLAEKNKDYTRIRKKDVYKCVEVIESSSRRGRSPLDYSLVRLDREVEDREPLRIRKKGRIGLGEGVYLGGYPSGLPLKMAGGAIVRKNSEDNYFLANLDSFEGNSGGPVFNSNGHFVEGILVGGEEDYVWSERRECFKAKRCFNLGCEGEEVMRIEVIEGLKDLLD